MSKTIENLEELANKWGKEYSKRNKLKLKSVLINGLGPLTDSPNPFIDNFFKKYKGKKINAKVLKISFDPDYTDEKSVGEIFTSRFNNDTDGVGSSTFIRSHETSSSFSWSITKGIELGIKQEITVGLPGTFESKTEFSASLSVSSTNEETKSETDTWEIDRDITISPHTNIEMSWIIYESKLTAKFNADIEISGYFILFSRTNNNKSKVVIVNVVNAFNEMKAWNILPEEITVNDNSVTYHATGECRGKYGVDDVFTVKNIDGSEVVFADLPVEIDVDVEEMLLSK